MRYRLRTLLILMALVPPLIGFWPAIKRRAVIRASQITASDVAVVAAATSLIAVRIRLYRTHAAQEKSCAARPARAESGSGDV